MPYQKKIKLDDLKNKISNEIVKWSFSKEMALNVLGVPYNTSSIFFKVIMEYIKCGKNVIYITNENEAYIEIIDIIRKNTNFRDYTYIRNNSQIGDNRLVVTNYENAVRIQRKFDLIIYDDIRSLPYYNKHEIICLMKNFSDESSKLIAYGIESIFITKKDFSFPVSNNRMPLVEPRSITTRIDINKDIPYMVYEYLEWSMVMERKVVIYVPDGKKIKNVYSYLSNFKEILSKNIMYFAQGTGDLKILFNFVKLKRGILITDDLDEAGVYLRNSNIMVYFADDHTFDYKKLVYFCGKVGREGVKENRGEVVFLAREETYNMEIAKNITRSINKEAWEMGLLNI